MKVRVGGFVIWPTHWASVCFTETHLQQCNRGPQQSLRQRSGPAGVVGVQICEMCVLLVLSDLSETLSIRQPFQAVVTV